MRRLDTQSKRLTETRFQFIELRRQFKRIVSLVSDKAGVWKTTLAIFTERFFYLTGVKAVADVDWLLNLELMIRIKHIGLIFRTIP